MKPGAFVCPACRAALQIDRSKLPPGGARGRCPACKELVLIPAPPARSAAALVAAAADSAVADDDVATRRFNVADLMPPALLAGPAPPAETDTVRFNVAAIGGQGGASALDSDDSPATRRLSFAPPAADDDGVIEIDDEAPPEPLRPPLPAAPKPVAPPSVDAAIPLAPRVATPPKSPREGVSESIPLVRPQRTPSAARSRATVAPPVAPAPKQRGGAGSVVAGLLSGALLGGGGGYLAIVNGLLAPPPAPLSLPGGEAVSWGALLAGAGALVGTLLGMLARGRR